MHQMIIAAICREQNARLAAKRTVPNAMVTELNSIYFDRRSAKLANEYWNMLVDYCFLAMIKRKTKYENIMNSLCENEKKSLMQHLSRCPVQNKTHYDSKSKRN